MKRPYRLVAASAVTAPLVAHYRSGAGVLCGEKRHGRGNVPAWLEVDSFVNPSAFALCEACHAAAGPTCRHCVMDRHEQCSGLTCACDHTTPRVNAPARVPSA